MFTVISRVALLVVSMVVIPACSSDSGGGDTPAGDQTGKGGKGLTDGTYKLLDASFSTGTKLESYTMYENTVGAVLKYDSTAGRYRLDYTGKATLAYTGGSVKTGCESGTRSYSFRLDADNKVTGERLESACTDFGPAIETGAEVLSNIWTQEHLALKRTLQLKLTTGETYTYTYTYTPK